MSAALTGNDLLPHAPGGNGAGAAMALVVHAGLIVALTVSVDWRANPNEVVAAELWSSVPQIAAPRPTEPPPPPPPPPPAPAPAPTPAPAPPPKVEQPNNADIAIERERRAEERKRAEAKAEEERKRAAEDKRKAAEADKKKREQEERDKREQRERDRVEEQRLAQQREENLRRMMSDAGTATSRNPAGTAAQDAAPSAAYAGRIAALIRRNSVFTSTVPGNPATEVELTVGAGGTIISRRIVKSSGHAAWDEAVLQAIDKAGKLPPNEAGRVPPSMLIRFRPKDE